ncbi:MAG: BatA domain-containing protein [Cyclobacteriaceae bacterium]|nr:BatA domain-containing protein [Cyclobacteriaceae bacterium]MDW8331631.1 BatA domain-containing protein [Cyclobacteriaceae bacterium]
MSFVNPAFLWALTALAIPIIVHLFSFRKTQRVYFSSNRFLRQVQQATASRQKLKHLLILAARLLFLFFLVMAFAQPFIPAGQQVTDTRSVTIYIDNSLSMSAPVAEKERALDAAMQYARQLTEVFPPDTRYRLITNDFAPFSNSMKSKTEFLDLLSGIRLSPVGRSLKEIATRMHDTKTGGDFYLFSDFQKSTAGQIDGDIFPDTTRHVYLLRLPLQSSANVYADTAWLETPFLLEGERNVLNVRIRNTGLQTAEQLSVKLLINDIQVGSTIVSVPASASATVSFSLPSALPAFSKAEVRFNDFPVTFDNQLYLALNRTERIRVVEITESGSTRYIQTVFGNPKVFHFKSFGTANLNLAIVQSADLVVINEVSRPSAALIQSLNDYVRNGGSLLVIPAPAQSFELLRELTDRPVGPASENEKLEIESPDFRSPFFQHIVEEATNRMVLFQAKRVMDWGNDRSALIKLKNNQPLLSRFRKGNGNLYLLATSLQPAYTDFGNHFLFLPVMYRLAITGKKAELRPYYSLTETQLTVRPDSLNTPATIRLSGEQDFIPDQRMRDGRFVLELPRFALTPGFYFALHQSDTLALLAFNPDRRESEPEQHTEASLMEALSNPYHVQFISGTSAGDFGKTFRAQYLGTPLWRHALILSLIFLLTEILLIRFWR